MKLPYIFSKQYISSQTFSSVFIEKFDFSGSEFLPDHRHEFFEIAITVDGDADHITNGRHIPLTKGSVYLIPIGSCHAISIKKEWKVYNVYLLPSIFNATLFQKQDSSYHVLKLFLMKLCGFQTGSTNFQLSPQILNTVNDTLKLLETFPFDGSQSFAAYRENCIINILLLLAEEWTQHYENSFISYDSRLLQINDFIQKHLDYPLHDLLADLGKHLMLHPQHLNRIVKNTIGIPISQYIMNCKIEKSIQLLCSGNSVTEVACMLGFYDHSHFHKYFLRYTGMSPSFFRKNYITKTSQPVPSEMHTAESL